MSSHIDDFEKAKEKRFDDGQRCLILVLGAGLNDQAIQESSKHKEHKYLTSWPKILEQVCLEESIPYSEIEKVKSYTSKWEKILRLVQQKTHNPKATYLTESELIESIICPTIEVELESPTYTDLVNAQYRDICSINFDMLLEDISTQDFDLIERASPIQERRNIPESFSNATSYYINSNGQRIWHLHGTIKNSHTVILGTRRYGRYIQALSTCFRAVKDNEILFLKQQLKENYNEDSRVYQDEETHQKWHDSLRTLDPSSKEPWAFPKSWLDLWMCSDIAFVGCSLGTDEFPLWWSLHQRSSNFARWRIKKPQTFYLTTSEQPHLEGAPADVKIVKFDSYSKLWESVLCRS